jgi:Asp-tRNA(Asn)/Glu-tRNA(Gln) amidotransferase A subunit family amidase
LRQAEGPFDERDFFTACANIAGLPAISIPSICSCESGLPVGVQLMAKWHRDDLLVNSADWFIKHNADNFVYSSLNI